MTVVRGSTPSYQCARTFLGWHSTDMFYHLRRIRAVRLQLRRDVTARQLQHLSCHVLTTATPYWPVIQLPHWHRSRRVLHAAASRGVATGVGVIGIYTHPKSVHLKFLWGIFLLPMRYRASTGYTAIVEAIGINNLQDFL